jgi:ribosomal-protein-alanine N-acetyltransferase
MSVIERVLRRDGEPSPRRSDGVFEVATMRRRDLKNGVFETERHAYPNPWSPSVFSSELDQMRSGSRHYVVARRVATGGGVWGRGRGAVAGHAGLWFTADEAHVTNVAVHPDARRRGVATLLMLALADEAIRRKCLGWTLEVRESSVGAQRLYERFGFEAAGIRKRYYENTEDAIVMWCNDIQSADYAARLRLIGGRS